LVLSKLPAVIVMQHISLQRTIAITGVPIWWILSVLSRTQLTHGNARMDSIITSPIAPDSGDSREFLRPIWDTGVPPGADLGVLLIWRM
jgi:hypothetical protein